MTHPRKFDISTPLVLWQVTGSDASASWIACLVDRP
jgi:hypothetical protein